MDSELVVLDSGYSSLKGFYKGAFLKIPTSIAFANSSAIEVGNQKFYEFEGDAYVIGEGSIDESSFTTTDYKFKHKFEPLIIKHYRDVIKMADEVIPNLRLSLALIDWHHKEELIKRCSEFIIDGKVIRNNVTIIPQGLGAYFDYIEHCNGNTHPTTAFVIEIGYNTVNTLYFENGQPVKSKNKGYPNHGVSSIIRPFTNYMEQKFSMAFSEQEAITIFMNGKFLFDGALQQDVSNTIIKLKDQFVKKLFNSILVADRKLVSTSEKVILAGGGNYFLENTVFPPNVFMVQKAYEFSQCRGMI